jgi:flagellar assembly factor FliW
MKEQVIKLETKHYGFLNVAREVVITFPEGLPGFEQFQRFVLVRDPKFSPFEILLCVDDPTLSFALINPLTLNPTYSPNISPADLKVVGIESDRDLCVYAIVTVLETPEEVTANLFAPLVINSSKMLGKQVILEGSSYSMSHRVLPR